MPAPNRIMQIRLGFAGLSMAAALALAAPANAEECTASDETAKEKTAAETASFSVEREMKESGEKAGTEDINIGVGELQECSISKSMDRVGSAR